MPRVTIIMLIEVVGILNGKGGRSCGQHNICGKSVVTGAPLIVRRENQNNTSVLSVHLNVEPYCFIGYLRKWHVKSTKYDSLEGKAIVLSERDLSNASDEYKRRYYKSYGILYLDSSEVFDISRYCYDDDL